jgi:hypothetical protein
MTSISPHTTRANGTILSATIYNSDHTNHISNAQALNAGKIEGATPPVVDGEGLVFDGTSGSTVRSLGSAPVVGPAVSVIGNAAVFSGITGNALSDSGIPVAHLGFGTRTDIASAATTSLATITSHFANITGVVTITSFGTSGSAARPVYLVKFAGALQITHHATSLICPDGVNLTTAANDYAWVEDLGSNNWRIWEYIKTTETFSPGGRAAGRQAAGRTSLGAILTDAIFPGALLCIIADKQTQNTDGAALVDNTDTVRTLNTLVYNRNTIASIASNRFTLPAGTYFIRWTAPVGGSTDNARHQSFLYNQTDAAVVERGQGGLYDTGSDVNGSNATSDGAAVVTIAGSKAFEIRHHSDRGGGAFHQGNAANIGGEVYTLVMVFAA